MTGGGGGRVAYVTGPGLSIWLPSGAHLKKNGCRSGRHHTGWLIRCSWRPASTAVVAAYSIAVAIIGVWIKTGCSEETLGGLGDFTSV